MRSATQHVAQVEAQITLSARFTKKYTYTSYPYIAIIKRSSLRNYNFYKVILTLCGCLKAT